MHTHTNAGTCTHTLPREKATTSRNQEETTQETVGGLTATVGRAVDSALFLQDFLGLALRVPGCPGSRADPLDDLEVF